LINHSTHINKKNTKLKRNYYVSKISIKKMNKSKHEFIYKYKYKKNTLVYILFFILNFIFKKPVVFCLKKLLDKINNRHTFIILKLK
jgi:hypothetical protein